MAYTITVPEGYGYVILVSLGATPFLSTALAFLAGSMRKAANVPYPNFYPTPQAVKESKDAYKYTCAQRSHANYLENMPQAMISMLVAGLTYPRASAALGAGWIVSRMLYAYGYIYGPRERNEQINGQRILGLSRRPLGSLHQDGVDAALIARAVGMDRVESGGAGDVSGYEK